MAYLIPTSPCIPKVLVLFQTHCFTTASWNMAQWHGWGQARALTSPACIYTLQAEDCDLTDQECKTRGDNGGERGIEGGSHGYHTTEQQTGVAKATHASAPNNFGTIWYHVCLELQQAAWQWCKLGMGGEWLLLEFFLYSNWLLSSLVVSKWSLYCTT